MAGQQAHKEKERSWSGRRGNDGGVKCGAVDVWSERSHRTEIHNHEDKTQYYDEFV